MLPLRWCKRLDYASMIDCKQRDSIVLKAVIRVNDIGHVRGDGVKVKENCLYFSSTLFLILRYFAVCAMEMIVK